MPMSAMTTSDHGPSNAGGTECSPACTNANHQFNDLAENGMYKRRGSNVLETPGGRNQQTDRIS
jgi:hypothetical protein